MPQHVLNLLDEEFTALENSQYSDDDELAQYADDLSEVSPG